MVKIGIEIHGYLTTKEKLFCNCKNAHKDKEAKPNTFICPTCTGQPGSKPMLPNQEAIKKLIQIALMLNCKVNTIPETPLIWWRKHYSWPDLPKGYQNTISGTYANPVGVKGNFLGIGITEVHLEEDPAAWNPDTGEIDYNRSGAPLVEIVTDPDFKSSEQVEKWLKEMILTMSYIKTLDSDAGIKADINVSINGGERIEIKNMNSLGEIKKAIEYEIKRQEKNPPENKETRMWNPGKQETIKMRTKESHADYRFIKDPDLPIIKLEKSEVETIKKALPESPMVKLEKLIKKYKIDEYYSKILISNLELVEFFEKIIDKANPRLAVPWVTVELLGVLNYNKKTLNEININPEHFITLLNLIENKKITELKAKDILRSWKEKSSIPDTKGETIISNKDEIDKIIKKVIETNQKAAEDFKSGNLQSINFLIGAVMKLSNKRADFKTAKELLEKKLK
ncbi:MAG: Asp-tRNA(Asn)/Glu-tRNA(Gln) amidotransferase subunit GatB [archaeon]|nr:Asp-tRNA(Asn)/Glu-tRNA(Gln) amidotransferase subunit GatB [archaeon]